ncbi:MAG: biotin/lipoyl-binding protein [Propionibacteriaceae bacterium]|jgi:macrolide-specific efflux system membrane fusion protein|nr:biotin/lipoyl-binding protein [Propionibacteriaceae bacterium]
MDEETTEIAPAAPRRKKRHWLRWTIVGVVVVLVAGGIAWWFLKPSDEPQYQARTYTAKAEKGTQTETVSLTGTLTPRKQAELSFSVSGEVTKVYVKVGDKVEKGDKLARVDDTSLQNAVDLAQANLTAAEASAEDAEDGTDAAQEAADAQVDSAQASLTAAKKDLANAVLRATIAGTVAQLDLEVGDQVSGGSSSGGSGSSGSGGMSSTSTSSSSSSAQVLIVNTATWKLSGSVGSADLASLKAGQSASITVDGVDDPLKGSVTAVGVVATSSSDGSATFPVEIKISGKQTALYSGTTASATVTVASYDDVLTVPTMAITTVDGQAQVNVVGSDGSTTATNVTLGRVFGSTTEITDGLAEGDEVSITMPGRTVTSGDSSSDPGGFQMGVGGGSTREITGDSGGARWSGGGAPPGGGAPQGGGR